MEQVYNYAVLPEVRGSYRYGVNLSKTNWFGVGGVADVLFKPADIDDLSNFLKNKPKEIPYIVLGVGSNLLVRDKGFRGVVIKLGREFTNITTLSDYKIRAGAAALDYNVAIYSMECGIGGLEFFAGIPGTIGGALAMNAGAYGKDTSQVLISATIVAPDGAIKEILNKDINYYYRGSLLPKENIFVEGIFEGYSDDLANIKQKIDQITSQREATQPIRSKTGGSTFKNPEGKKAWQLIDQVGMRGYKLGGAMISDLHCNFFINTGDATATDIEELGELVRTKVFDKYGIMLEWEIRIIGEK